MLGHARTRSMCWGVGDVRVQGACTVFVARSICADEQTCLTLHGLIFVTVAVVALINESQSSQGPGPTSQEEVAVGIVVVVVVVVVVAILRTRNRWNSMSSRCGRRGNASNCHWRWL